MSGENHDFCLELLRTHDPDRYPAVLWLPAGLRPAAAAIYAFNAEIARIPALASEAQTGEIRLQWWSETLSASRDHGGQPIAVELLAAVARHRLPVQPLLNLIEARRFDLYHDPIPDIAALEAYAGHTASALLHLIALAAGAKPSAALADASGHGGVAQTVAGLLRLAGLHRRQARCYIPGDILSTAGLDVQGWLNGEPGERHVAALNAMVAWGRDHLAKALDALGHVDRGLRPVFLPLAPVSTDLDKVEKAGIAVFARPPEILPLRRQWIYFKAALGAWPSVRRAS